MPTSNNKILLTTPDYPPFKVGGLSTFSVLIENALKELNVSYEVFVWKNLGEAKSFDYSNFKLILNVHFLPSLFYGKKETINFIHGAEIIPYSPNLLKNIYKKLFYHQIINKISAAKYNFFVSEFGLKLYQSFGAIAKHSRDIVFHNCIQTLNENIYQKDLSSELKLCAFVRNVPHKNIEGIIQLFSAYKKLHNGKVTLFLSAPANVEGIVDVSGCSNEDRERIYQDSHLNILLSLDHRKKGNIEGFGLTVLEAGKYGTPSIGSNFGGIPEAIHHMETGYILPEITEAEIRTSYNYIFDNYSSLQKNVYQHTHSCHSSKVLTKFLGAVL